MPHSIDKDFQFHMRVTHIATIFSTHFQNSVLNENTKDNWRERTVEPFKAYGFCRKIPVF
jgi:hypothetical protein